MAYVGGYSQAVNDETERGSRQAYIAQVAQALQHQTWLHDQQRAQLERDLRAQAIAGQVGPMMLQPPQGPPAGPPLQPPMPGQGSVPMMMPPPGAGSAANMMGALAAGPPPAPMAPPGGMPAAAPNSPPPEASPGWRPSPAAPPELGGAPPAPSMAPMGGAGPGLLPPPTPPKLPAQMLSIPNAIAAIEKLGITDPAEKSRALDKLMPMIKQQNEDEATRFRLTNAADAAAEAARAKVMAAGAAQTRAGAAETTAGANVIRANAAQTIADAKSTSSAGGTLSPETKKLMAERFLAGDKSVVTGLGYGNRGAENRAALQDTITEEARAAGMSGADIAARMAEYHGIMQSERTAGQRSAQVQLAASEANKMADILLTQSQDYNRTQFQPINTVLAAVEKGGGGVAVRKYAASINSFINAYARAIAPTGVATVSDKDHAREILSLADSQEQMEGIMDVLRQEMQAAMAAPKETREALRKEVATPIVPTGGVAPAVGTRAQGKTQADPIILGREGGDVDTQYNALPRGYFYKSPDGQTRQKR